MPRKTIKKGRGVFENDPGFESIKFDLLGLKWFVLLALYLNIATWSNAQNSISLVNQGGAISFLGSFVALSPDGAILCTTDKQIIRLWDVKTGLQLQPLIGVSGDLIENVRFTRDGKWLAAASLSAIHLWNLTTGKEAKTYRPPVVKLMTSIKMESFRPGLNTASMTFTQDESAIVVGELGGGIYIFNRATGDAKENATGKVGKAENILSVSLFPDGKSILTGSEKGRLQRWSLDGDLLKEYDSQPERVTGVVVSPEGSFLASISADGFARVLDPDSGAERYQLACSEYCEHLTLVPNSQDLIVTSIGQSVVWNARTGSTLKPIANVGPLSISGDGRLVSLFSAASSVSVRDLKTNVEAGHISGVSQRLEAAATSKLNDKLVLTDEQSRVYVWDLKRGNLDTTFGLSGVGKSIAVSGDGRQALIGTDQGTCTLVDLGGGMELRSLKAAATHVNAVALSLDGTKAACGGEGNYDIAVWDLSKQQPLRLPTLQSHTEKIVSLVFSKDGAELLSGSKDNTAVLWDVAGGFMIRRFGKEGLLAKSILGQQQSDDVVPDLQRAAFTPDGAWVVTTSGDGRLTIWDATSAKVVKLFNIGQEISDTELSSDGKRLISADASGNLVLRSFPSGVVLHRFVSQSNGVGQVMFASDQDKIVSSGGDDLVRIWKASGSQAETSASKPVITLTTSADNWAVADAAGRFDTNDLNGQAPMHWISSDAPTKPLPFELFVREYFTPGLLARVYQDQVLPRVAAQSDITNRLQPYSKITAVEKSSKWPDRVDVTVSVADEVAGALSSGVRHLRLFRDGRMVGMKAGEVPDKEVRFEGIMLPHGRDHVEFSAYAYNDALIRGKMDRKNYPLSSGTSATAKAYLINIGVNYSAGTGCGLTYAADDAKGLQHALSAVLAKRFTVQATTLVSIDASSNDARKEDLKNALAKVVKLSTPDDVVFITYSGHGFTSTDGTFYLFPSDTQGNCGMMDAHSFASAISGAELKDWLQDLDGAKLVLILDACNSAGAVVANGFRPAPLDSPGLGQLAYDKEFEILAASQRDEQTKEYDNLQHGLLSYLLLKGMETKEADWHPMNGQIELIEWLSYPISVMTMIDPALLGPLGSSKRVTESRTVVVKRDRDLIQGPELFDFDRTPSFILQ